MELAETLTISANKVISQLGRRAGDRAATEGSIPNCRARVTTPWSSLMICSERHGSTVAHVVEASQNGNFCSFCGTFYTGSYHPLLRYDGVYVTSPHKLHGLTCRDYLRFYPDGAVVSICFAPDDGEPTTWWGRHCAHDRVGSTTSNGERSRWRG
jgi:hypothetical protein